MTQSNLDRLRELTHQLVLEDLIRKKAVDWVRYDVSRGNCIGIGLLKERSVAVQKSFLSKDTVFPAHVHEEVELLVIYEGAIECNKKTYSIGDICRIAPGSEHEVVALEDTWLVAITIPASSAYPDAEVDDKQ